MIRGKLKVILVVTRHSSKFCTRFGHVVTFKLNVTTIVRMPVFFKLFKTIFQKNVLRAILYLNRTPAFFGTNCLVLFLFVFFILILLIFDKVSCGWECEQKAVDNTKLTKKIKKISNNICVLSLQIVCKNK